MNKFFTLSFLPKSHDITMLLLRVGFGGYMLIFHGWGKLIGWSKMNGGFPDPLGIGSPLSLAGTIGAEVFGSIFLILGLYTRLSAVVLTFSMGVGFFLVHGAKLSGDGNGELAAVYGMVFIAVILSGAGKYSLDAKLNHQH